MWLWEMKQSCLPHSADATRQVSFSEIEQTEPLPIIDWKWENGRLLVLVHEVGWLVCDFSQDEHNEEVFRDMLSNRWIAAQYAEMAYFNINHVQKGLLET